MLARVSAGNAGIREYLEYGMKQGREFSRDELDERLVLDGDLSVTDALINQIEDKGQDRYLHITLSFRESNVDSETLSAVADEYKALLMAAYGTDEYNFYAEAHLPKTKTMIDKRTGEQIERKPHIHIVIPKVNTLTGNVLNPVGRYTSIENYHDAIQEYVNKKFNLESPKDFVREGDDHYSSIISRVKGDIYGEKKNDIQQKLASMIKSDDIRDFSKFKDVVSRLGEVKVRNSGKENEYLALKIKGADKFINLKSPLFSKVYIESRQIKQFRPTDKQVHDRVDKWITTVSKEIKHVHSATPSFREKYYGSSKELQKILLTDREIVYEQRHRGTEYQRTARRQSNNQSSINDFGRKNIAGYTYGLSGLPQRGLVYGVRGKEFDPEQTERVLSNNEQRIVANERREKSEYSELRRFGHNEQPGRERVIVSSFPEQKLKTASLLDAQARERAEFSEVRRYLKPERLLSVLKDEYGLNPEHHPVTFAKDGSARINAGKQNLNVSDFLTKHMNIPWDDAKSMLKNCYAEQKLDEKLLKLDRTVRREVQALKAGSWTQYKEDKSAVWKLRLSPADRQAALSIALFERLKRDELIRENAQQKVNGLFTSLQDDHIQPREDKDMGLADAFKGKISDESNSFANVDSSISVKSNMERLQREQDVLTKLEKRLRLNDLIAQKKPEGQVEYKSKDDGKSVFKDTGDRIEFTKGQQKDENIALGLEIAMAKYGSSLKLTGSDAFKERAIKVAAERGLSVIFTPEKYQEALKIEKERIENDKNTALEKSSINDDKPSMSALLRDPVTSKSDPISVEYRKTPNEYDERFSLLINGKPAEQVLKDRPELIDVLQKNEHLKQFSREELVSGVIDQAGKGRAKDDILDMNGKSVKSDVEERSDQSKNTEQSHKKGMGM